jgi:23S rRNA pseudouridine2605 synthase
MMRLQKYMSECGVASRRKSEELIKKGEVYVNGRQITELGFQVSSKDEVIVSGKEIKKEDKEYYLLYKPNKTVSSVKDEKGRTTVVDLIESKAKLFPVGRLDYDTSGLLLITNDGELSNILTHPKYEIERVYEVKIDGLIKGNEIKTLENGIVINNIKTKKCKIKLKKLDKNNKKSYLTVKLEEGKNHEVKNLFAYFNYKVLKLKRIRYAFLTLDNLKMGEYRRLSIKEIKDLKSLKK